MTTTKMSPECRGPFEFLDLISTGGRQLCKCGNYTIFKPILKNNVRLPVAICYSLSFTSWNHAGFGFANRCCRALCVKGGAGECLISRNEICLVSWVQLLNVQPTSLGEQNYGKKWQFWPYLAIFGHRQS